MESIELIENLKQIKNVIATSKSNLIEVKTHISGYTAKINCEDVQFSQLISSPTGENCLQIFYSDGGGIIVTPNDFVFNVEQDEYIQVNDLPPMCSIREMVLGFDNYRRNPNPSKNHDNNLGLFYVHYYIMKSAVSKGFHVDLIDQLYEIGINNGFFIDNNETSNLFKKLGMEKREIVNQLSQTWNGYCPESHLYGKTVKMRLNRDDFYESEETGLQILVFSGVQAVIMNFRGNGKFRTEPKYAHEIENGEILSPQNTDRPPFNNPTEVFENNEQIKNYIKSITS